MCKDFTQLISELHRVTQNLMDEDQSRGTQQMEIYALEIQMYSELRNLKKLKVSRRKSIDPIRIMTQSYRKYMLPPRKCAPPSHILVSWALSKSVEGRCG